MAVINVTWHSYNTAGSGIGTPFSSLIGNFNIFGFGADPIVIAISLLFAFCVALPEIKRKDYTSFVVIFIVNYASMFATGIATSTLIFGSLLIIGAIGIILAEGIRTVE